MKKIFSLSLIITLCANALLAMETTAKQAIVVDYDTGTVIFDKNAGEKMHPSSMTKLMTIYILFSRLKEGSLKMEDELPISEAAWATQGSKTFVDIGGKLSIENLIRGIIIQSGNDACVVVAEGLSGSVDAFATLMNDTAKKLGMQDSHFTNPHGLPDDNHLMSARDLSILAKHLIQDFPEYYHYFSEKEFEHNGIKQGNRNLLLYKDIGVDGLKTGHTDDGGYGMVISGKDASGRREIVVVNGLEGANERADEAEKLYNFALRDFENLTLFKQGDVIDTADVWMGTQEKIGLTVAQDIITTLPKTNREKLKFTVRYTSPLTAPLKQGDKVAELTLETPNASPQTIPLVANNDVAALSGFAKSWRMLTHMFSGK